MNADKLQNDMNKHTKYVKSLLRATSEMRREIKSTREELNTLEESIRTSDSDEQESGVAE